VFRVGDKGLELIEVAPGVDIERDVFAQMDFRPAIATDVHEMDARIFAPQLMGLKEETMARERRHRSQRIAEWYGSRA
jgi:propionate CoA-transferase